MSTEREPRRYPVDDNARLEGEVMLYLDDYVRTFPDEHPSKLDIVELTRLLYVMRNQELQKAVYDGVGLAAAVRDVDQATRIGLVTLAGLTLFVRLIGVAHPTVASIEVVIRRADKPLLIAVNEFGMVIGTSTTPLPLEAPKKLPAAGSGTT